MPVGMNVTPNWKEAQTLTGKNRPNCIEIAYPENRYDACLSQEQHYLKTVQNAGGFNVVCRPHVKPWYPKPPWLDIPPQGKEFTKIGVIPLPAVEQVDTPVFLDTLGNADPEYCPYGWDGVINTVVMDFTGTGLVEGSGDIVWRLRVRRWFPPNLGGVTVRFGSMATPQNMQIGIRLFSGADIQMFVNLGAGALTRLGPGNIICLAGGWFYPQ